MKHVLALGLIAPLTLGVAGCSGGDEASSSAPDAASAAPDATTASDASAIVPDDAGARDAAQSDAQTCGTPPLPDALQSKRDACAFAAGAHVLDTLGVTAAARAAIPITHVMIVTEENRAFDHYFGKLSSFGQPGVESWPATFANPDLADASVSPMHLPSPCLPADPPHQGDAMKTAYADGGMNGFVRSAAVNGSDGHYVMGYYDGTDLPFYYWLASTFAIADRYFGAALGGTWANRDYLYAATSDGILNTGERVLTKPTIFDALDHAGVGWAVYSDGTPRQDCLGWTSSHVGVAGIAELLRALKTGDLPPVTFVDPTGAQDEHPTNDVNGGEQFVRSIYEAALTSPLWSKLAIVFTYDESGGLFDHVPPPAACIPSADQTSFDRRGMRVPAMVISPWARPHYVSHVVHDHTSVLRLVEAIHDLPALTARDANADALLDMFDFGCAALTAPAPAPAPGKRACP